MQTEELIRALAADAAAPVVPISRSLMAALALGTALTGVLFLLAFHPRVDLAEALATPAFVFKLIVVSSLGVTAATLLPDCARPLPPARKRFVLLLAPALLAGGVVFELLTVPEHLWLTRMVGHNAVHCISIVPLLSVTTVACLLIALRRGAPAQRTTAGAIAGLTASAVGATLYALTCPDDSPLFIATWYSLSILAVTAISAGIARRLLRW